MTKFKHTFDPDEKYGPLSGPLPCKDCGEPVYFRDKRVSENGVRLRLGPGGIRVHRCKKNPYNWTKQGKMMVEAAAIGARAEQQQEPPPQQQRQYTFEYFELLQRIEKLEARNSQVIQSLNNLFQRLRLLGEFLPL